MSERLTIGKILGGTAALLRAHPLPALIAVVVLVAPATLFDTQPGGGQLANLGVPIISLFAQYMVTRAVLRGENLQREPGNAGSFIGVSIVTGLAIGLGMLLLIVPGLYLYARWSIAMPLVIGEGKTMSEAMDDGGVRTAGHIVPIMLAFAAINLTWLAGFAVIWFVYPPAGPPSLPVAIAGNLLLLGALVIDWYAAVAIYKLTDEPRETLAEVFA